jgi:hypothetical protein
MSFLKGAGVGAGDSAIDAEHRCDFHITFVFQSWHRHRELITPHRGPA